MKWCRVLVLVGAAHFAAWQLAACASPGGPTDVGDVGISQEMIVGGSPESGYPNVVFLYRLDGAACTGTIIAPRVVLTAAHCVDGGAPSIFRIYSGSSTRRLTAEYRVTEVHVARNGFGADDVAVLVLATPASEAPMEIGRDRPVTLGGQTMTAVGFGQTPTGGSGTKYRTTMAIDGFMGGFVFVRPSVCSGDSGGPLIAENGAVYGVASFIYSPDGMTQPSCGTAPGAYNEIYQHLAFIDSVLMSTGNCVGQPVEICNGLDDNCDEVVDEGCIPLGDPCALGSECVGGLCAETPIGMVCTSECDALRPEQGCGIGSYCASSGSCIGHCVPGEGGTQPNETDCTADTDCESLFCSDPGDGRRRCLDSCQGDAGLCLAGEVCGAPGGGCGGCVPASLIGSARGLGEPCEIDGDCRDELVCYDNAGISECAGPCSATGECGEGFECRADLCIRDRRQGVGGACAVNADCGEGICAIQGDRRWCTAACGECPIGFNCIAAGGAMVCAPTGALAGEPCASNADCVSDLCVTLAGGDQVCTNFCDQRTPCAPGFDCRRTGVGARTAVCVEATPGEVAGGDCSVSAARKPATWPLGFALTALALVLWRRRN